MDNDFSAGAWDHSQSGNTSDTTMTSATSNTSNRQASIPLKQIVTIRLDIDMLNWYKSAGPGYQTRINQLLRDHMNAQLADAKAAAN
jgi:uncharacterized protein (DUF4415 family)